MEGGYYGRGKKNCETPHLTEIRKGKSLGIRLITTTSLSFKG